MKKLLLSIFTIGILMLNAPATDAGGQGGMGIGQNAETTLDACVAWYEMTGNGCNITLRNPSSTRAISGIASCFAQICDIGMCGAPAGGGCYIR